MSACAAHATRCRRTSCVCGNASGSAECDLLALAPSLRAIGLFDVLVPRDPALKDVMERRPWKQKARIAPGLVHATIETD